MQIRIANDYYSKMCAIINTPEYKHCANYGDHSYINPHDDNYFVIIKASSRVHLQKFIRVLLLNNIPFEVGHYDT